MEIAYSGDAFHTYMVISSEEWGENEDEEKMMSNQSAQVLLPFQVQRLNDRKITATISADGWNFEAILKESRLIGQ